jgi:drug/metabolite transporter (DMT)-like permease
MTALLALGSAIAFGTGDFLGGLASRTAPPMRVTAVAQVASAVTLVPLLLLVASPSVAAVDVVWGAIGGLFGLVGILLLFTALGEGPMGIVAPITAVVSAIVPVTWGFATGERPGTLATIGIVVGLVAVVAVTVSDGPAGRLRTGIVAISLGAGLGFAVFFIALAQTSADSGLWPLAGARAVSVPAILVVVALRSQSGRTGSAWRLAVASGALDMGANALFLSAAQRGLISVAAVLSALYPAATAILARIVLHERMSGGQIAGVGAAIVAVVLIGLPA